ncbi:hypothetical protein [Magnetococcus sp. PR-3]|uniref:hypothetical protein n=1 Tax=Magnetococcus sp. PR-3 TaxID=3120355 RepID=UPI002FCDEDF1
MAVSKYLKIDTTDGKTKEALAVDSTTGVSDAGKVVALDTTGKLSLGMMPTGIGPDLKSITVGVDVAAGDFVNIYDDAGTLKVRPAQANANITQADGFVKEAATVGNDVAVYFEGVSDQLSGLTPGERMFLSADTAGATTNTPPTGSGHIVQYLGKAVSATELAFEATDGITLA